MIPEHTGSRATRIIGALTLAGLAAVLVLALVVSPPDQVQGDAARLIYLHVPGRHRDEHRVRPQCARQRDVALEEVALVGHARRRPRRSGVVFTALTLLTGMIWGRPTWGVYWTWDARLTSFSLLFLMYLGYLVVRRLPADLEVRNRRSAYVALLRSSTCRSCTSR